MAAARVIAAATPTRPETTAAGELQGATRIVIVDHAFAHVAARARGLRLSRQLGIYTVVDASGRLTADVEVVFRRGRVLGIDPVTLRVGRDVPDGELLADGGILGRCRRYNRAISWLRQLALRIAAPVRAGRIRLLPATDATAAHAELAQIDKTIERRQATHMDHGVVRLHVLAAEIALLEGRCRALTPIVVSAERAIPTTSGHRGPSRSRSGRAADGEAHE